MSKKNKVCRANGSGTIEKRGKYYLARWVVHGHKYSRSTGETDRAKAEAKLAEFVHPFQCKRDIEIKENLIAKVNVAMGDLSEIKTDDPIRIDYAIDYYEKDPNTSQMNSSTYKMNDSCLNVLKTMTKCKYLYEITDEIARSFLETMKPKWTASTYNTKLALFKRIWNTLMPRDNNIKSNPWKQYKNLPIDHSIQRREIKFDEIKRIEQVVCSDYYEKKFDGEMRLMFLLGIFTPMRREDCATFNRSSILFEENMIRRMPMKTSKKTNVEYVFKMHPTLRSALKNWCDTHDGEYLLPRMKHLLEVGRIARVLRKVFQKAGMQTYVRDENGRMHYIVGFHSFRIGFATKCGRNKIGIRDTMKMMGHKTESMSIYYQRGEDSGLRLPSLTLEDKISEEDQILTDNNVIKLDDSTLKALSELKTPDESMLGCLKRIICERNVVDIKDCQQINLLENKSVA